MKLVHWPLKGGHWTVAFGTARRGLGGALSSQPARLLVAVPYTAGCPSMASVPITVLLYNGPLLCGFNVSIKGLSV